jgi:Na+/H+ antiporter NhaD/arsenite permease-like protein
MTIFVAAILKTWQQLYSPSERQLTASLYSLAFAANIGAVSFTFPASLAGLLWRGLLLQKGVHIRPAEFLRRCVPVC